MYMYIQASINHTFILETYIILEIHISTIFRFAHFQIYRVSILQEIWKSDNAGNIEILQIW